MDAQFGSPVCLKELVQAFAEIVGATMLGILQELRVVVELNALLLDLQGFAIKLRLSDLLEPCIAVFSIESANEGPHDRTPLLVNHKV